jgi:CHAD domain-containing protein
MNSYEKGTIEGKFIEALHNMRVSSRRLQAVLKVFRAYFPPKKYKREYYRLRDLIRSLGEVRHIDVFKVQLEAYRNRLNEKDRKAIHMLIVRQNTLRTAKRKILVGYFKYLNKSGFKENFIRFISAN